MLALSLLPVHKAQSRNTTISRDRTQAPKKLNSANLSSFHQDQAYLTAYRNSLANGIAYIDGCPSPCDCPPSGSHPGNGSPWVTFSRFGSDHRPFSLRLTRWRPCKPHHRFRPDCPPSIVARPDKIQPPQFGFPFLRYRSASLDALRPTSSTRLMVVLQPDHGRPILCRLPAVPS